MKLTDKELERIRETIAMIPQDVTSIVEVGCGDGRVSRALGRINGLTGIDIAPNRIGAYPGNKIMGDIASLPIKSSAFDLALSCEVLEHLDDRSLSSALQEMERVTNRFVLITVPFKETLPAQWCKCSKCSHVYHAWGHLRKFDLKSLSTPFVDLRLVEKRFIGPKEPRIPSTFYIIARYLGNVWESDQRNSIPCPECGSMPINRSGNIFGKLLIRFLWRVERIWPQRKPVWVACLYRISRNQKNLFFRDPFNRILD